METRGCSAFLGALGMYALLIDIGNTSLKIGLGQSGKADYGLHAAHGYLAERRQPRTSDRVPAQPCRRLPEKRAGGGAHAPHGLRCQFRRARHGIPLVRHACERYLDLEAFCLRITICPFLWKITMNGPTEVGADRLVGAFGARRLFPDARSVVSVDYGTATNFDCVTGNAYLGGLICPGVMSSAGGLSPPVTAQLPADCRVPIRKRLS